MIKAAVRVMGTLAFLLGLGDIMTSGTVFRQMFGGVVIIMGILFFVLGELIEIREAIASAKETERQGAGIEIFE